MRNCYMDILCVYCTQSQTALMRLKDSFYLQREKEHTHWKIGAKVHPNVYCSFCSGLAHGSVMKNEAKAQLGLTWCVCCCYWEEFFIQLVLVWLVRREIFSSWAFGELSVWLRKSYQLLCRLSSSFLFMLEKYVKFQDYVRWAWPYKPCRCLQGNMWHFDGGGFDRRPRVS
jgi:hypothetical protein